MAWCGDQEANGSRLTFTLNFRPRNDDLLRSAASYEVTYNTNGDVR